MHRRRSWWSPLAIAVSAVALVVPAVEPVGARAPVGPLARPAAAVPSGFVDEAAGAASSPTAIELLPTGQLVVLEQGGRLLSGLPGAPLRDAGRVPNVCTGGERGLLGLTHDPGYTGNGWVYVYYTRVAPAAPGGCVNRVSRFTLTTSLDVSSEVVLLDNISSVASNHNGGDLDIGADGHLYVAVGDAGRDPRGDSGSAGSNDAAGDVSLLNGKILRITRSGQPAPGNPFAGAAPCAVRGNTPATPTTPCPELYAWGLRNPYRFAFDTDDDGGRFFINDVGQGTREEVDLGAVGAHYGWNQREGQCPQGQNPPCAGPPFGLTDPIVDYPHAYGRFVTGGAFVPHGRWPAEFDGAYLFGDGGSGAIFVRWPNGAFDPTAPFATGAFGLTDMVFATDEAGRTALYYTQVSGSVRRIVWTGATAAPAPAGLRFVPAASRAYDSRDTPGPDAPFRAGSTRLVPLSPPPGAAAAFVNVTMVDPDGPGHAEIWTARRLRPGTSVVNAMGGDVVADTTIVPLDASGSVVVYSAPTSHVIVDVLGWFVPSGGAVREGRIVPLAPQRLADTRSAPGTVLETGATNSFQRVGERIDVQVTGRGGVPSDGTVSAAVLQLTIVGATARGGWVAAHPVGTAAPGISNLNANYVGDVRANLAVVALGAGGAVSITTAAVVDVVVDVVGYVTSSAAPVSTTGRYTAVSPVRIVDSRIPAGLDLLTPWEVAPVDVGARVPGALGSPAVVQNVTITQAAGPTAVTASAAGAPTPNIPNLSTWQPGTTRATFAVTPLAANGRQQLANTFSSTHVLVDVVGHLTP